MELLYFDFDHGVERLLFIRLDRESLTVHFRLERGPDPTYDEECGDVPTVTVDASTSCSSVDQFCGFCRALVAAMRDTPFSLQDPGKTPFAPMSQDALVLDGIGEGVPPDELTARIPPDIATEILGPGHLPERFRPLVKIDDRLSSPQSCYPSARGPSTPSH
jgi:hypothetical protein